MTCSECNILLARRLAGDANPREREALEAHLRACPACGSAAGEFDRLGRDLTALGDSMSQAQPTIEWAPPDANTEHSRRHAWRTLRPALAAAAMIACALLLRTYLTAPTPPRAPSLRDARRALQASALARKYRTVPLWPRPKSAAATRPRSTVSYATTPTIYSRSTLPASRLIHLKTPT
ncbi:MAG: zf-HC2 domain-containing protein, partial [Phycisphaerae bacterium]